MDVVMLSRRVSVACLAAIMFVAPVNAKPCSARDAEAADLAIDHLDSWAAVAGAFKKFGHCDEGSIAEGNSEAIARLLADQWATLPQLAALIKRNPALKRYVLRHVDSTLRSEDLERIQSLSSSSCPENAAPLCAALYTAAGRELSR